MFSFLKKKSETFENPVKVDIHSHLIPGIDDGAKSLEESIAIIKSFCDLGYRKLVTTPHIMKEFYDNNADTISSQYRILNEKLKEENLDIEVEFAAEYYLDEFLIEKLEKKEPLLTFGPQYVLVETSFYNAPVFLKDVFFKLSTQGYKPVFAHPERYLYLHQDAKLLDELHDMQVLFQINIGSLSGYYSPAVKKLAEKMIEKKYVHFLGTDCHNLNQLETIKKAYSSKIYKSLPFENILNNTLMGE